MHTRLFKIYIPTEEEIKNNELLIQNIEKFIIEGISDKVKILKEIVGLDDYYYVDSFYQEIGALLDKPRYRPGEENIIKTRLGHIYRLKGKELKEFYDTLKKSFKDKTKISSALLKVEKKDSDWYYGLERILFPYDDFTYILPNTNVITSVELYFRLKGKKEMYIVQTWGISY